MQRGTVRVKESVMVAFWVPKPLVAALDEAVRKEDTDRSKFIRRALRRHVELVQKEAA